VKVQEDGRMSNDYQVPVHQMLISYRVPGRLKEKRARENERA
jgi:hypothetical protein